MGAFTPFFAVVPSRSEGVLIVFYHPFQRSRSLPRPHPGMLHIEIIMAQLTKSLVVNLKEALPRTLSNVSPSFEKNIPKLGNV